MRNGSGRCYWQIVDAEILKTLSRQLTNNAVLRLVSQFSGSGSNHYSVALTYKGSLDYFSDIWFMKLQDIDGTCERLCS